MSSTLIVRQTPKTIKDELTFKQPIKGIIARKFYEHDGSLGGSQITIGNEYIDWFEGVLAGVKIEPDERIKLEKIIDILKSGNTIDMWFDV